MLNNLFGNMRSEAMHLPSALRFVGKQVEIERERPNRCSGPDDWDSARQDAQIARRTEIPWNNRAGSHSGMMPGDSEQVEFYIQYDSNPKGGVIHWTHHDPDGKHVAGWLKHNGIVYQ